MYGFPEEFDAAQFADRCLDAVTYGSNVIVLVFEDSATVSASAPVTYRLGSDTDEITESPSSLHGKLVGLVGHTVRDARTVSPKEVVLRFDNGGSITLTDSDEHYECFLLSIGGKEFVV